MTKRKKFIKTLAVTCMSLVVSGNIALASPYPYMGQDYVQPQQVKELFKVPTTKFNTPGFEEGKQNFTTYEEMMSYLYDLQKKATNMQIRMIGSSQEGLEMPLIVFSNPSYVDAEDVLSLDKPIVWLQGQQHGNEPAGGESTLVIAEQLATGSLGKEVLDDITVIIVPRSNPDGSAYFERRTATGIDVNRDHLKLELPETIALHKAYNEYKPEVVIDAHEYTVEANSELASYYDMLILSAKNLNIPEKVRKLSDDLFIASAEKGLDKEKYTHHWYYTDNSDVTVINEGGTETRIGRNAYGLQPALSFLVESRGIGIGRENFERRVMGHVITHTSMIKAAAKNAKLIKETVSEARTEVTQKGVTVSDDDKVIVTSQNTKLPTTKVKVIDQVTGKVIDREVEAYSASKAVAEIERVRPYAYIMPPAYHQVAEKLANSGVEVKKLQEPMEVEVESYKVTDKKVSTTYYEGHFRNYVTTEVTTKLVEFPAGSYVYYMAQPTANLAVMALEPEADSSFVTFNIIPVDKGEEVPVYRFMKEVNLTPDL